MSATIRYNFLFFCIFIFFYFCNEAFCECHSPILSALIDMHDKLTETIGSINNLNISPSTKNISENFIHKIESHYDYLCKRHLYLVNYLNVKSAIGDCEMGDILEKNKNIEILLNVLKAQILELKKCVVV